MSTIQVDRIIPFSSASVTVEGLNVPNLATTGSNTFVGDQNIVGTITASIAEGFALVGGVGSVSTLVATSSFGGALPSGVVSGSTQISALGFATTGSNTFTGLQRLQSNLLVTSSLYRTQVNVGRAISTFKQGFNFPVFESVYTADSSSVLYNFTDNLTQTASYTVGVFDNDFTQDVELLLETTITNGVQLKDIDSSTGVYTTFLRIAPNGGTNPPLEFKRSVEVTGSVSISSVLELEGQNPLPTGGVGQLAVSASNLYYHNGTSWAQIN